MHALLPKAYQAIELATKALIFTKEEEIYKKFEVFLREFASELTADQRRKLTEMGIDLSLS